jgi:hypothetical protein
VAGAIYWSIALLARVPSAGEMTKLLTRKRRR